MNVNVGVHATDFGPVQIRANAQLPTRTNADVHWLLTELQQLLFNHGVYEWSVSTDLWIDPPEQFPSPDDLSGVQA